MNISLRQTLFGSTAIAAMALCGAHGANAQTHVLGGGSTLAALDYGVEFSDDGIATAMTYCSIGSGAGTSAFINNLTAPLTADTTHCPSSSVTGKSVDYGASDAFVSDTNWKLFNSSAHAGNLIQIPMFGTPVTMALNPTLGNKTVTADGQLTLSDVQLCGIFSSALTSWSQVTGSGITTGLINVAYRGDSSGTSYLLTSHLKAVCPVSTVSVPSFTSAQLAAMPTQTFAASLFGGTGEPALPTTRFFAGTGSSGVQSAVINTTNTIGYLSPDYTHVSSNGANLGYPFVAQVTNSHNSTNYVPNVANTKTALGTITAPTGTNEANPDNWAPLQADPTSGYPIAGFTYWFTPTCYAAATTTAKVVAFLQDHLNEDGAHGTTIDDITAAGFVSLPGVSDSAAPTAGSYAAAVNAAFLASAGDGQHLQIATIGASSNNTTQCHVTGVVGR